MSLLQIGHWLEKISIEQLPGMAIASSALCLACFCLNWMLRRRSGSVQAFVWQITGSAIVFSSLVLAVVPGVPLRTELNSAASETPEGEITDGTNSIVMPVILPGKSEQRAEDAIVGQSRSTTPMDDSAVERPGLMPSFRNPHSSPAASALPLTNSTACNLVAAALAATWLFVCCIMLVSFVSRIIGCYSVIAGSSREVPTEVRDALRRACVRLGIVRIPDLVLSKDVPVPLTAGVLRPVIVLPSRSATWPQEKLEMVVLHELAHVERHDVLWHWIGRLTICLAWFNPLVWLAARRGVLDRERACDDRVIDSGIEATSYGQCLVEIAAAMTGRQLITTGAVSMAEPPLKQRLHWILSPTADRRCETTSLRGFLLATLFCLAILLGIIRPLVTAPAADPAGSTGPPKVLEVSLPNHDSSRASDTKIEVSDSVNEELIELTPPVTGIVTSAAGIPVAGVQVLVKLRDFGGNTPDTRRTVTIRSWQMTTDKLGRYTVDVSNLGKQPSRFCIGVLAADKTGFAQGRGEYYWQTLKEVASGKGIKTTTLLSGRKITGQILDSNGDPIGAVVKAWAMSKSGDTWLSSGTEIGEDGKLKIEVPADSDAVLAIYSVDHSPVFVSAPSYRSDLEDTTLPSGTIVSGRVLDIHNQPAKGVVVELKAESSRLKGLLPTWSRVAVTDDNGAFTLLPASGDSIISVRETVAVNDAIGGFESVSGNRPPLVVPVELKLKSERSTEEIVLRESETWRIAGTARWDDGEPVRDLEVIGSVRLENSHEDLATVLTDANGNYEMWLPKDSHASVRAIGAYRDRDKTVWYMAKGIASTPFIGESQIMSAEKLTADFDNVDWELRPQRATVSRTQVNQSYDELLADYHQQMERYRAATTPEEKERLDPRNGMAARYSEFYQDLRGERMHIPSLLHDAVSQSEPDSALAKSVFDPCCAIAKARVDLVERLIDQDLGDGYLANMFDSVTAESPVPRTDAPEQMSSGRSLHPMIRATALLLRAEYAREQLRNLKRIPILEQQLSDMKDSLATTRIRSSVRAKIWAVELMREQLVSLKAIDEKQIRTQASLWLDAIEKDHADLRCEQMSLNTFGYDAKAVRFAIEHVNAGQPAPQIETTDINGKLFRLSDHLGKVVVISFDSQPFASRIFSFHIYDKKTPPYLALSQKFEDEPFEYVTISRFKPDKEFIANTKSFGSLGTFIRGPDCSEYPSNWGTSNFPTTWIVDKSGTLAAWSFGGSDISETIEKLLKE